MSHICADIAVNASTSSWYDGGLDNEWPECPGHLFVSDKFRIYTLHSVGIIDVQYVMVKHHDKIVFSSNFYYHDTGEEVDCDLDEIKGADVELYEAADWEKEVKEIYRMEIEKRFDIK